MKARWTYRIVCAFAVVALAAALMLAGCGKVVDDRVPGWGSLKTYLDGDALSYAGGRLAYTPTDGAKAQTGIDVSEHQGLIDWSAVASDGISFAFVRLGNRGSTEGGLYEDESAAYNIAAAQSAGIVTYGYFYSQAVNAQEALEEADYAISLARENGLAGCYLALDLETETGRTAGLSASTMSEIATAFCDRIAEAGYLPLVYGNRVELTSMGEDVCATYPVWLANYTYENPLSPCAFVLWQYASDGEVAGIDTSVDLDLWINS